MNDWQNIGYNLEAKIITNREIWVRNCWQTSDYPHLIIELDSHGATIDVRTSDGSHAGSMESRYAIAKRVEGITRLIAEKLLAPIQILG